MLNHCICQLGQRQSILTFTWKFNIKLKTQYLSFYIENRARNLPRIKIMFNMRVLINRFSKNKVKCLDTETRLSVAIVCVIVFNIIHRTINDR